MRVLVGCEESQVITIAFRKAGHESFSCDIQNCSGGHPEWHIKADIIATIKKYGKNYFDLIILHPDCTKMAVSGNRWCAGTKERKQAIEWTVKLWNLSVEYAEKVALENPVSVIWKYLPNVYYIQPWQFGHGETKKTGFCLHNLRPLKPTNIVSGREQRIWKMPPSQERSKLRSKTYLGIGDAIVKQWGIA